MKQMRLFLKQYWPIILITLIGLFLRFWRLDFPKEVVFDETYYAKFAQNYLTATPFFDVHPPLGKVMIALGEIIFGNNSFGWRVLAATLGTLLIPLVFLLALKILKNKNVALLASTLILLDGLFLVESRTALLINSLVFFIILSYYLFLQYIDSKKIIYFIFGALFIGVSISIQWLAVPFWLLLGLFLLFGRRLNWWKTVIFFLVPIAIYLLVILFDRHQSEYQNYFQYLVWWHKQAFGYHLGLKETHPYASRWWTWLLMWRPVWFYSETINGKFHGIDAIGNPIIWWTALITLLYSIWDMLRNKKIFFIIPIFTFIAYYLSWIVIGRTQFQYYILPVLPFYFMILAYYWDKLFRIHKAFGYFYLAIIVLVFLAFYPILTAYPVSDGYWRSLMLIRNWI